MNDGDKKRFWSILVGAADLYSKELTAETQKLYWRTLCSYPLTDVERAFERAVGDPDAGQFMPKPADIIRQIEGDTGSQALIAWGKVQKAIGSVGYMGSVAFDDPVIHSAVEKMGGWEAVCLTPEKELPFLEKRFVGHYRAQSGTDRHPLRLVGREERENRANGYLEHIPPTRLIGDVDQARLLLEQGKEERESLALLEEPAAASA